MAAPLRVLYLDHAPQLGGAERSLLDLIGRLDRREFLPLVALPGPGPLGEALLAQGVEVLRLPLVWIRPGRGIAALVAGLIGSLRASLALLALLGRERVDIVHANGTQALLNVWAAALLSRRPFIWQLRDLPERPLPTRLLGLLCHRVVCISEAVRERFVALAPGFPVSRLRVIHPGVEVPEPDPAARARLREILGLVEELPLVGMCAQMVPWKRHELFLEMARVIATREARTHFVLIGDDPFHASALRRRLEAGVRAAGLDARIHFTGWREDAPELLAGLDLLVHPTCREPFGRSVAEALVRGVPVVAVAGGGAAEILKGSGAGLLVPPEDAGALAEAVCALLQDSGRRAQMAAAGPRHMARRFPAAEGALMISQLYRELPPCASA
ncbi:MAG: glycosyltransferase [Planctomycetes bacterium]|nr:glycosyltransferase [Planctomycetota bacterium]